MEGNHSPVIHIPKMQTAKVGMDGRHVVIEVGGRLAASLPWEAALELAKAITAQARKVEELVKANEIISDQAFLRRLGVPLGLSSNPDIQSEAHKAAQYDPYLRKVINGSQVRGIPSDAKLGTPGLIQHEPKEVKNGR